ncbi:MAG: DUF521 domain-containing protein [Desulfobacterales bacterium]|nr:DUF521 domain-containing protein [Desulfobacterales bacterium]
MRLTREEQEILSGGRGEMLQRVMRTVVAYGEALEAERLVDITGMGHFVITSSFPGISPSMEMLDALIAAGLKTPRPFTLDPIAPLDFENWWLNQEQIDWLERMYHEQKEYDERMLSLGLWSPGACTCTPYLPEVGNTPGRGDVLAWSESACVVFANSALGARSNRNGAIIDLLCNLVGKTPLSGFLTDKGRRATWRVEVKTEGPPAPQVLGAAIGGAVLGDVPYIVGLERFLGAGVNPDSPDFSDAPDSPGARGAWDYLHDLGAGAASAGAVGLFHVEGVTPEAMDYKTDLLTADYKTITIDDQTLQDLVASYPVMWKDKSAAPGKCFLGCPHFSRNQLNWWAAKIRERLIRHGEKHLRVNTTICAAPRVLEKFIEEGEGYEILSAAGARFSPGCPMQVFDDDLSRDDAVITNSNKLRAYTHARFFPDEEIADVVVTGKMGRGA